MRIMIVGAGIGGTILANRLARLLAPELQRGEVDVVVLSASRTHLYQPGLLHLALGQTTVDALYRDPRTLLDPRIALLIDEVLAFAPDSKQVRGASGNAYSYDWLVIATGSRVTPEEVPGLAEHAHGFYTEAAALRLAQALQAFDGGRVVVTTGVPHKCPMAPLEMTFLLHDLFVRRGIAPRVDMLYTYPIGRLHSIEAVAEWARIEFARRGIRSATYFNIASVDGATRTVHSEEGLSVDYDLLIAIPPHRGAEAIERSGLGARGWVPTHRRLLSMQGRDDVFVLGDTTNLPVSKAGSTARFQAEVIAANLASRVRGGGDTHGYDGKVLCFIETSRDRATYAAFNYAEPPHPRAPSRAIHMAKTFYHRLYWSSLRGFP